MNEEIIAKLIPAAMIENADGMADSFKKMSVNIDRVLRSDFASGENKRAVLLDEPVVIKVGEDNEIIREDKATDSRGHNLLTGSAYYEEPYITVPRIV
ncbi:MAG: hypothetical protein J6L96_10030 [Clostridia bacterium]|nr:hypothetical protein [Clostridia bacterium]